jgi:hypothetical protein
MTATRWPRRPFRAVTALLLGALAAGAVRADGGPIVFNPHEELPTVGLQNVQAALDVLARYQSDSVSPAATGTHTVETTLQQTLDLSADSWIVHPNLADIHLSGQFGVEEDFLSLDGQPQNTVSALDAYDASVTLLRKEPVTTNFYAHRDQQLIFQQFAGALTSTTESYGGTLDYRSDTLPTHVGANFIQQNQTDPTGASDFTSTQGDFEYHSEARPDAQNSLSWGYNYNNVNEISNGGAANTFSRHDANFSHTYTFGASDLASVLTFSDQQGSEPLTEFRDTESLRLRHSKTFETDYRYSLDYQEQPGLTQIYQQGSAGFIHRLYDSLVTSGGVAASLLHQDPGGNSTDFSANLDFDYHKKVPLGLLSLSAGGNIDFQSTDAGTANTLTTNQPFTFVDPTPVVLNHAFINNASVRVTDSTGAIVYTPGVDYTVTVFPGYTQITRVLGGHIANDQAVLVSYLLSPEPAMDTQTLGTHLGARYDFRESVFRGLGVYARYYNQSQEISSSAPLSITPEQIDDYTLGADYHIWKLTFTAEYEDHASTVDPYTAVRVLGSYYDRFGPKTSVGLNVNHTETDYVGQGDQSDFNSVTVTAQHQFTRELFGSLSAAYQYDQDQLSGLTSGFDAQVQITWHHRQTDMSLLARQAFLTGASQSNTDTVLQFDVKRRF